MITSVFDTKSILLRVLFFVSLFCTTNVFPCEDPMDSPRDSLDQPFILYDEDNTVLIVEYISGEMNQSNAVRVNLYWDTDSNRHYVQRGFLAHDEQSLVEADPDAHHEYVQLLYDKADNLFYFVSTEEPEELDNPYDDESGILKRNRMSPSPENNHEKVETVQLNRTADVVPPPPASPEGVNNTDDSPYGSLRRLFGPQDKSEKPVVSFVETKKIQTIIREKKHDCWEIEFREVTDNESSDLVMKRLDSPQHSRAQRAFGVIREL